MWSRDHAGDALVELLSEDTIRLTLTREISWSPGQHAYVILPSISNLPFEAHPFSIASIPEDGKKSDVTFLIRGRSGFTQRLRQHAANDHGSRVPAFLDGPYGCPPDLTRYSTCVLLAGLFYFSSTRQPYSDVYLGGSGISYTLPLLLNLIRLVFATISVFGIRFMMYLSSVNERGGKSVVRRVVFVWAVRDAGM